MWVLAAGLSRLYSLHLGHNLLSHLAASWRGGLVGNREPARHLPPPPHRGRPGPPVSAGEHDLGGER